MGDCSEYWLQFSKSSWRRLPWFAVLVGWCTWAGILGCCTCCGTDSTSSFTRSKFPTESPGSWIRCYAYPPHASLPSPQWIAGWRLPNCPTAPPRWSLLVFCHTVWRINHLPALCRSSMSPDSGSIYNWGRRRWNFCAPTRILPKNLHLAIGRLELVLRSQKTPWSQCPSWPGTLFFIKSLYSNL